MLVGQLYDIKKDLKKNPSRYVGTCGVQPDSDNKQRAPDFRAVLKYAVADGSLLGKAGGGICTGMLGAVCISGPCCLRAFMV